MKKEKGKEEKDEVGVGLKNIKNRCRWEKKGRKGE